MNEPRRLSSPDTCTCEWHTIRAVDPRRSVGVPALKTRDGACVNHGDRSEWWRSVREHAQRLAGEDQ